MNWHCYGCGHDALLTAFYFETEDAWDYKCPSCGTLDNQHLRIPRLDIFDKRLGREIAFYVPTPKQVRLHIATSRNVLWGGRAGTGKSWALRHDAYMRCLSRGEYRVLILRRNFTELVGTHLDKAATEAERIGAIWRASEKTMVFKNGSRIRFGHCENDDAVRQYLSEEFDCILIDEGATFTEYAVRFVASRLRTSKKGVTPFMRIGSNPGAMWLYEYYIEKRITNERDPSYDPADYEFIPATWEDNPHVSLKEQEMRLNGLPSEALRQMYRDGNWLAVEGQFFTEWKPRDDETGRAWHVIQELPTVDGRPLDRVDWVRYVRAVDWGYDPDEGVCTWFALLPNGRYIAVKELTFRRMIARDVAKKIAEESSGMKIAYTVGGTDMWMKSGQTGESIAETFARNKVSMQQANQERENGWQRCHALLVEVVNDGGDPMPKFQVYEPGCPSLARTIPMMQNDPKNPGDILEKSDHWVDTWRTFAMSRPSSSVEPKNDVWARFHPEIRRALMKNKTHRLGSESVRRG